ncbi:MAG: hypothetical protein AB7K52_05735 [Phycisphaerales bacterium]
MSTYPTSPRSAFLAWAQAHAPVFTDEGSMIGLNPTLIARFNTAVAAAAAAELAATQARQVALAATEANADAFAELREAAGDSVRSIRAFAENSTNPGQVYQLAQIPAPRPASPVAPPARPTNVTVGIDPSTGDILLKWKAANPLGANGTSYIIRRRTSAAAPFEFIGVTGKKAFTDASFTAGPDMVQYTIQGQRADASGPVSEIVTVNFGRAPGMGAEGVGGGAGEGRRAGSPSPASPPRPATRATATASASPRE